MQGLKEQNKWVQSPLNYTGGKYKLLEQILPFFPERIRFFVDLFCGGGNVGVNVQAEKVIFNDANNKIVNLLNLFKASDKEMLVSDVFDFIKEYGLSLVSRYGYSYYGCNSYDGVGSYNKQGYVRLREDFNKDKFKDKRTYYEALYVLIIYAFNNQIRFNAAGQFNLPVGKRDFNDKMQSKLYAFMDKIQNIDSSLQCVDFRYFPTDFFNADDFFYCDPPYLITCASYNEQGGWNAKFENSLLCFLDVLDARGIKFALSNVLSSNFKENHILKQWINDNGYRCEHLNYNYTNSNYHKKDKSGFSDEVLIMNY